MAQTTRLAGGTDTGEIVRLATGMFTDMNGSSPDPGWQRSAHEALTRRLGHDVIAVAETTPMNGAR